MFSDEEDDDGLGIYLAESFAQISQSLSQIRSEMHHRFDVLDVQLQTSFGVVIDGLTFLSKQGYESENRLAYSISHVEQEIISLNREMNYAHDENFLVPFNYIIDEVENYYDRFNTSLPFNRVIKLIVRLEMWLLTPPNAKGFNGSIYYDLSIPAKITRTLMSSHDSLCGFYATHYNQILSIHPQFEMVNDSIPNYTLWKKGLKIYLSLRKLVPNYDINNIQLQKLVKINKEFINTIEKLCSIVTSERLY